MWSVPLAAGALFAVQVCVMWQQWARQLKLHAEPCTNSYVLNPHDYRYTGTWQHCGSFHPLHLQPFDFIAENLGLKKQEQQ